MRIHECCSGVADLPTSIEPGVGEAPRLPHKSIVSSFVARPSEADIVNISLTVFSNAF